MKTSFYHGDTEINGEKRGLWERRDCFNGDVFTAEVAEERRERLKYRLKRGFYEGVVFHYSLSRRSSKNEDGRKMRKPFDALRLLRAG